MAEEKKQELVTIAQMSERISQNILNELGVKEKSGLVLPENYNAENAIMSAMMIIQKTVDKNQMSALQVCKPA
jgi:hypothetical protein